jgi:hypothetical protein
METLHQYKKIEIKQAAAILCGGVGLADNQCKYGNVQQLSALSFSK